MTTEYPLISIITVVYNGVKTIEQTIRSVIQQSYSKKEYIIIDGGSTDGTQEVIKKYEDQIDHWVSEPDHGIFDAMNKGISLAKGELIGIINADDWYEENVFTPVSEAFVNSGRKVVIHGLLRNYLNDQFYSIKGNSTKVLKYDMIQHPTCFIPKSLYLELGSYDTKYTYSADYDLVLRFVRKDIEFLFLERVIANFRMGGISSQEKTQSEKFHILRKHRIISNREAAMRLILLYVSNLARHIAGLN